MEIWPDQSRGLLAGLIGAAANVGYLLIGLLGMGLGNVMGEMEGWLLRTGLPEPWVTGLLANSGWRLLMLLGAAPALLTFFIRLFVPESDRWEQERKRGVTSNWATRDLLGVVVGAAGAGTIIYLWAADLSWAPEPAWVTRVGGSAVALTVATLGYVYPVMRYLQRVSAHDAEPAETWGFTVRRMLLGACLGGVALLGTWASIQWAPLWADRLTEGKVPEAKAYTQMASAAGAVIGTLVAALLGNWLGRRAAYSYLCCGSLAATLWLFRFHDHYGIMFLVSVFVAGALTASFYGWLPLYLPELFRTRVRATGQGFSYNFGRILAAIGVLQTPNLMKLFGGSYRDACSVMSLIYLVGLVIIWLAPETRGKPLPE
jgi:MFS family permease